MIIRKTIPALALILTFALMLGACSDRKQKAKFYYPGEFEPQSSTFFFWSTDYYGIIPQLTAVISQKDTVTLFLNNNIQDTKTIRDILKNYRGNPDNIRFIHLKNNYNNIWIRDYGPLFLINKRGEKEIVKFRYFGTDPGFTEEYASRKHLPVINSSLNSTGGSREVNGKGTMLLCEMHELDVNKPKTKEEIEEEMISKLNLKKIIWLKKGIPQDDSFLSGPLYDSVYPKGVNGHVDEFCRFANSKTILISSVTDEEAAANPILKEAKIRLDENYNILKNAVDQDGSKFTIYKVPMAPLLISDRRKGTEKRIVASVTSYMNFIITNSYIILPSYLTSESPDRILQQKEKKVGEIFREVFPNRKIIRVRADIINYYSGGFHCISINEPLAGKVK
ncbi:MAG TPA: agmatine deiminase family protein [Bacteroidales bacterium]|nr:agmatine deiminase family protein [Bacteroidales bacterium]